VQGRELQSDDNSGLLWNCQISRRLDAGTTYYFHVRHQDDDGTGGYWLFLGAPNGTSSDDHGNSTQGATLVADEGLTPGNIEVGGDLDLFHFFATSGGPRLFETSSDVDTVCRLLDAQGVEIAANDDAGEGTNCRIRSDLEVGHRYFVEVRLFARSATGTYRLRLSAAE
jgi:catechol 2,3-dioxygenase-like lactoylglutathione lyase family enzyme